jgi:PAS domain S-box-containing protein
MDELSGNFEPEVESRARLAAIVDSSDDVIVSKTLDGIITSWNPSAERLFGWTAAEAIGQRITLIVPDDRRAEEDEVLARLRRGERIDHFETVRITKAGRLVDMSITVSPIKDASGRIVGASKVARDISERRRIDEERAALLAREQEARRQAEALNRAKDELLATVSHELRTPLNAIFGWARLMKDGDLDAAGQTRAVETIIRNAALQARLVDDLLDLSRIVAGRMRLALEPTDLNAAIEAALDTVQPAAQAKDIALEPRLDDAVGLIQGAPDRLQQVVWNLVMNSIKFTAPGGRVDVVSRRDATGVSFSVVDTGQGIDASVLPYVFEPFRQADSSTTRAQGGLGLGLTLVRRLVEAHGGTVTAESAGHNRGSTFTVTFPLPARSREPGMTPDGLPGERRDMALRLQGIRILLVDDDADFLELSAISLRRAGAEVRAASSAAAAYEVADSWLPMVVVTDLAMTGEDGFVLARTMRRMFRRQGARVPIVAVTAYGTPEIRERAEREGFDLYVTKPVDPSELTNVVAGLALRRR